MKMHVIEVRKNASILVSEELSGTKLPMLTAKIISIFYKLYEIILFLFGKFL